MEVKMKRKRKVLNGEKKDYSTAKHNKWNDPFFRYKIVGKTGAKLRDESWAEYKKRRNL